MNPYPEGRLDIEGIFASSGGEPLLSEVSLTVAGGERVAILGPSGAGKSTLLRVIAGLAPVDQGTIRIGSRDVTAMPAHQRDVGLMFQSGLLFPHLDVAGNIGFGLRMRGSSDPGRVQELLELVGLPGAGGRDVTTLSGGEQQRVALARALAPRPPVLLLDEPFSALDVLLTRRLLADVRELCGRFGTTVVAVTHDPGEAESIADRWVVMDEGRIVQTGTRESLAEKPLTSLVAELARF